MADKMQIKLDDKLFRRTMNKLQEFVSDELPDLALKEYKSNTPKAGGNARNKTKLSNAGKDKKKIVGNYPYAGVLDQGLFPNPPKKGTGKTTGGFSTQAPRGMAIPTNEYIEDQLKNEIRKANTGRI